MSFDYLGYVGAFAFFARAGDTIGDDGRRNSSRAGPDAQDRAARARGSNRDVQNGAEVTSADNASTLEFAPKSPGAYRIEAYRSGKLWMIPSNPVYVR